MKTKIITIITMTLLLASILPMAFNVASASSMIVFEDNFDTLNTDVWGWGVPPRGNPYVDGGVLYYPSVPNKPGGRGFNEFYTKDGTQI